MRTAAGILMVAFALFLLVEMVSGVGHYEFGIYNLVTILLLIIPAAFIFTGGVFCLRKKYWPVCFASALVTLLTMVIWLIGHSTGSIQLSWIVSMVGTFPIIFVCLRKKEWSESQV
jgi:hypothetical protein